MATTTNLGLVKLGNTDTLKNFPSDHNGNMDKLDAAFGAGFGANLQPNVNESLTSLAGGVAVISIGNTHAAVPAGQFIYVRGHGTLTEGLYKATADISQNGTLSGSNVAAVPGGGLNAVMGNIVFSNDLGTISSESALTTALETLLSSMASGEQRYIRFYVNADTDHFSAGEIYTGMFKKHTSSTYAGFIVTTITAAYGHTLRCIIGSKNNSTWVINQMASVPTYIKMSELKSITSTLAYTGVYVTIPAHCRFTINAYQYYENAKPEELYICLSSSDTNTYARVAGGVNGGCTYSGMTIDGYSKTFYVWARAASSGNNTVQLTGWYEPV